MACIFKYVRVVRFVNSCRSYCVTTFSWKQIIIFVATHGHSIPMCGIGIKAFLSSKGKWLGASNVKTIFYVCLFSIGKEWYGGNSNLTFVNNICYSLAGIFYAIYFVVTNNVFSFDFSILWKIEFSTTCKLVWYVTTCFCSNKQNITSAKHFICCSSLQVWLIVAEVEGAFHLLSVTKGVYNWLSGFAITNAIKKIVANEDFVLLNVAVMKSNTRHIANLVEFLYRT